ncbi:MAG: hypothetical protein ACLPLP_28550 [Mycobacterium sp.]
MAAGDTWEWQSILDGIGDDATRAKQLLTALAGLYVRHVTAVCKRDGGDPVDWLNGCALEQIRVAKFMQNGGGGERAESESGE